MRSTHNILNGYSAWKVFAWNYGILICGSVKVFEFSQSVLIFNVGLSLSKKICDICVIGSPLKMIKNVFYFVLKALFILKIFRFLSRHIGHLEKNGLIRKIRLTSKIMTSQPGLQTIAIHILPNIWQNNDYQITISG